MFVIQISFFTGAVWVYTSTVPLLVTQCLNVSSYCTILMYTKELLYFDTKNTYMEVVEGKLCL